MLEYVSKPVESARYAHGKLLQQSFQLDHNRTWPTQKAAIWLAVNCVAAHKSFRRVHWVGHGNRPMVLRGADSGAKACFNDADVDVWFAGTTVLLLHLM